MSKISILDCIEAIGLGDISFKTLKRVTINGDINSSDFVWSTRNFAVFKVKLNNEPHKIKIWLTYCDEYDDFFKSVDRSAIFYNNIFVNMETYIDELNIYSDHGIHISNISVFADDEDKNPSSKDAYLEKFLKLTESILRTNLIIEGFSLKNCVCTNGELKISLSKGGTVLPFKKIEPMMLISFKNYLLSMISHINTYYNVADMPTFFNNAPKFKLENHMNYNSDSYVNLFTPVDAPDQYKSLITSLYKSTNREYCCKAIQPLIEVVIDWWNQPKTQVISDLSNVINKKEIDIIGEIQENRTAVRSKKNDKIGFINEKGELVIDYQYNTATDFEENISTVSIDSKFGAINHYGKTVVNFDYDELEWCVEYNIYIALKNDLNGILNRNGEVIANCEYAWIDRFFNSTARYQDVETKKFGYINSSGKVVIPAQWYDTTTFAEGFARVKDGNTWYKIDINGEII